jgi:hypothetical protein
MVGYRGPSLRVRGPITNSVCVGQAEIQRGLPHRENVEYLERISAMNALLDAVEEAWKKKNSH